MDQSLKSFSAVLWAFQQTLSNFIPNEIYKYDNFLLKGSFDKNVQSCSSLTKIYKNDISVLLKEIGSICGNILQNWELLGFCY